MIVAAWFIAGILIASVLWLLVLGLCLGAKERDELEAKTYVALYPPDVPDWASKNEDGDGAA